MSDPTTICQSELQAANACVMSNTDTCGECFGPDFPTSFPSSVSTAFRGVLAVHDPTAPEFCDNAEDDVCTFLEVSASCCCVAETTAYTACYYGEEVLMNNPLYIQAGCGTTFACTWGDEGGDDQMLYLMIGGAVAALLLCCLSYLFCRRRTRIKTVNKKGNGVEINVKLNNSHNVENSKKESHSHQQTNTMKTKKKKKSRGPPTHVTVDQDSFDNESDDEAIDWSQFETKHSRKIDIESGHSRKRLKERERSESPPRRRESRRRIKEIKESPSPPPRRRKKSPLKIKEREESESPPRRRESRTTELRKKRRSIETWYESEKKKKSSRSLTSDSESSEDSERRRERRRKRAERRKKTRDEKPEVEQSIRQARTLVDECEKSSETHRVTLIPDLRQVVDILEEEKRKLDARQKKVDEERMVLKAEIKTNKQKLECLKKVSEDGGEQDRRIIDESSEEKEKQMRALKREKEEMKRMMEMLESTRQATEEKIESYEQETKQLKMQKRKSEIDLQSLTLSNAEDRKLLEDEEAVRQQVDNRYMAEVQDKVLEAKRENDEMYAKILKLSASKNNLEAQLNQSRAVTDDMTNFEVVCDNTSVSTLTAQTPATTTGGYSNPTNLLPPAFHDSMEAEGMEPYTANGLIYGQPNLHPKSSQSDPHAHVAVSESYHANSRRNPPQALAYLSSNSDDPPAHRSSSNLCL